MQVQSACKSSLTALSNEYNATVLMLNTLDIRLTKNHDWICSLIW